MIRCNTRTAIRLVRLCELVIRDWANLTNIIQVIEHKLAIFSNKWMWTWLKYLIETLESNAHILSTWRKMEKGVSENNGLECRNSNYRRHSNEPNSIITIKQRSSQLPEKVCASVRRTIFGNVENRIPEALSLNFLVWISQWNIIHVKDIIRTQWVHWNREQAYHFHVIKEF